MARHSMRWLISILGLVALATGPLVAQGGKTSLQKRLGDLELAGPWFYDDLAGGFAQAKKTGKPLLVVFR